MSTSEVSNNIPPRRSSIVQTRQTTSEVTQNDDNSAAAGLTVTFAKDERKRLTPYEKLVYDSQHDLRFKAEENAGERIGFYRIRSKIGYGNFSCVKLGVHLLAKEKVAIKILDKTKLDAATQRLLLREITSMERLHHPNIVRLYEVIETSKEIYIVTEYASSGDLYTRMTDIGKLPEDEAKFIFAQITAAIDHMHSKGIIHRDIKSENVFFASEHLIKLGDLGFSTFSEKNQLLTTFCGSPPYAAPELYQDKNYIGVYVDIWALGVLLYFMVTALMPFRAENGEKLRKSVVDGSYSIPAHVSDECQELIRERGLLNSETTERWSMERIRSCSWLRGQNFPKELDPLPINLTNVWTSVNRDVHEKETIIKTPEPIVPTSSFEYEAHSRLEELGITSELLQKTNKHSDDKFLTNRDSINGTYRIILHRLQKQSSPLERDDLYDKSLNEDIPSSRGRSGSVGGDTNARRYSLSKSNKVPLNNSDPSKQHTTKVCIIL